MVLLMAGGLVANVAAASGQGVPAPSALTPGVPAWVQVSVATVWIHPTSPRPLDGPALTDPARIGTWLGSMTVTGRLGLHGRIDTQMVYGRKVVILSESGRWSRVAIPSQTGNHFPNGVIGWVPSAQLDTAGPPAAHHAVVVSVPSAWLYSESRRRGRGPPLTSQLRHRAARGVCEPRLRLRRAPRWRGRRPGTRHCGPGRRRPGPG